MMITMMVVMMMILVIMMMIFCNFPVLQISFLCYYLEYHVKLYYLNEGIEIPIFRTNLPEAVDTDYVVFLLINEECDSNVVYHKNQIKLEQNCFFIITKFGR